MLLERMIVNRINKETCFLFGIFITGVAIKLILWDRTPYISRDSVFYLNQIEDWSIRGTVYYDSQYFFHPPMFFYLVKEIAGFGFSTLYSALLMNILLGSFIPVIIYYIASELLTKKKIAIAASIIALFHPKINLLSIEAQRDIGFLFFCCLFCLFLLQFIHHHTMIKLAAASLCMNIALFFRIEGAELYPIVAFFWILYSIIEKNKKHLLNLALFFFFSCTWFYFICILTDLGYNDARSFLSRYYTEAVRFSPTNPPPITEAH